MAEGMFLVWRPIAQFGTDDGNERRTHVGQVVEGIGQDPDTVAGHADDKFTDEEEKITNDA